MAIADIFGGSSSRGGLSSVFNTSKKSSAIDLNDPEVLRALLKTQGVEPEEPKPGALNRFLGFLSSGETGDALYRTLEDNNGGIDFRDAYQFPLHYARSFTKRGSFQGEEDMKRYSDVIKLFGKDYLGIDPGDDKLANAGIGTAGFALDVLLDPLTYLAIGALGKAGKGVKAGGQVLTKADDVARLIGKSDELVALGKSTAPAIDEGLAKILPDVVEAAGEKTPKGLKAIVEGITGKGPQEVTYKLPFGLQKEAARLGVVENPLARAAIRTFENPLRPFGGALMGTPVVGEGLESAGKALGDLFRPYNKLSSAGMKRQVEAINILNDRLKGAEIEAAIEAGEFKRAANELGYPQLVRYLTEETTLEDIQALVASGKLDAEAGAAYGGIQQGLGDYAYRTARDDELIATHTNSLGKVLGIGDDKLAIPSFGIHRLDHEPQYFGDTVFVAKPEDIDPAKNPFTYLFGSDVYTPRVGEFGKPVININEVGDLVEPFQNIPKEGALKGLTNFLENSIVKGDEAPIDDFLWKFRDRMNRFQQLYEGKVDFRKLEDEIDRFVNENLKTEEYGGMVKQEVWDTTDLDTLVKMQERAKTALLNTLIEAGVVKKGELSLSSEEIARLAREKYPTGFSMRGSELSNAPLRAFDTEEFESLDDVKKLRDTLFMSDEDVLTNQVMDDWWTELDIRTSEVGKSLAKTFERAGVNKTVAESMADILLNDTSTGGVAMQALRNGALPESEFFGLMEEAAFKLKDYNVLPEEMKKVYGNIEKQIAYEADISKNLGDILWREIPDTLRSIRRGRPQDYIEAKSLTAYPLNKMAGAIVPRSEGSAAMDVLESLGVKNIVSYEGAQQGLNAKFPSEVKKILKEEFGDYAFRQADKAVKQSDDIADDFTEWVLRKNRELFGDDNVQIVANMITPDGRKAWGRYRKGLIEIAEEGADKYSTYYHETVHRAMDFLGEDAKKKIMKEASQIYGIEDAKQLEERFAEDFIGYMNGEGAPSKAAETLFERVKEFIYQLVGKDGEIENLYKMIESGEFAKGLDEVTGETDFLYKLGETAAQGGKGLSGYGEFIEKQQKLAKAGGEAYTKVTGKQPLPNYLGRTTTNVGEEAAEAARRIGMKYSDYNPKNQLGSAAFERFHELAAQGELAGVEYTTTGLKGKKAAKALAQQIGLDTLRGKRAILMNNFIEGSIKEGVDDFGERVAIQTDDVVQGYKEVAGIESLKGWKVRDELADELTKMHKAFFTDEGTNQFLRYYDKTMGAWKLSVTGLFPSFHVRNFIGNNYLNWLADVNPKYQKDAIDVQRYMKAVIDGSENADKLAKKKIGNYTIEEIFNLAKDRAVMGSGPTIEAIDMAGGETALKKLGLGKVENLARGVGTSVEDNAKIAHFIDKLVKTGDPDEAALSVKKYLFDYSDLTDFEKNVMRRVIPFYTFMRKNLELHITEMFNNPRKLRTLAKGLAAIKGTTAAMSGMTEEDVALMPDWAKKSLGIYTGKEGDIVNLVASFGLPIEQLDDLIELSKPTFGENVKGTVGNFINQSSPLLKMPIEMSSGYNFFREQPIEDDTSANAYRSIIEALAARGIEPEDIGVRTYTYEDRTTGEERTGYSMDAETKYLLNALAGKSASTATRASSALSGDAPANNLVSLLSGVRNYEFDLGRQQYYADKDEKERLQKLLIEMGLLSEFTQPYLTDEAKDQGLASLFK